MIELNGLTKRFGPVTAAAGAVSMLVLVAWPAAALLAAGLVITSRDV